MQINPIQQSFQALPIKPNITKSSIITSTILLSTILGSAYLMQDRKYNESCTKIENLNVLNLPSTSIENLVKTYGLEDLSIEEIDFGSYRFSAKTGLMEKIEGEVHTIPNEQNEYFGTITKSGIFEDETYEFVLQQKQNYNNNVVNKFRLITHPPKQYNNPTVYEITDLTNFDGNIYVNNGRQLDRKTRETLDYSALMILLCGAAVCLKIFNKN